ncbi:MAG: hypothetical protein ABIO70_32200 [Pseudomonadota bacterium]
MTYTLEALLAVVAGMVLISAVWLVLLQRARGHARFLTDQLRMVHGQVEDLERQAAALLSLAQRALPPGKRPELAREAVPALDTALQEWSRDIKELHRRLVVNLHVIAQLRKSEEQLNARVLELEELLVEAPEYVLRARFQAASAERDYYRRKLLELQQALPEEGDDIGQRLADLTRQNEMLRAEIRQARRLAQVMQRQIAMLQREDAERAGIAMRGLLQRDLEPGAFDSISDLPLEDPEEFTGPIPEPVFQAPLAGYDRPRAGRAAPPTEAEEPLPEPIAPFAAGGEGER